MISTHSSQKGFTLIEVMVATAVLSFGTVLIFQAFFTILRSFDYYQRYLCVSPWMNEKIWEVEDTLRCSNNWSLADNQGQIRIYNKQFNWTFAYSTVDETAGLYKLDLKVSWTEGRRHPQLSRTVYVFHKKEQGI